ncbi:MAG: alanine racemase, partial [Rhodothermales bacterium]|nr:alanine racemase [Rhodothermales bacterium]
MPQPSSAAPTAALGPSAEPPVPIRAEVHLDALRHNVRLLREQAGEADVVGVVKSNAYGHGVEHVVPVLREEGVRRFAVANVPEGARLRALGVTEPVLVFAAPLPDYLPAYAEHDLECTVSSRAVAEAVAALGPPLRVHVKVDTGMHRIGIAPEEASDVLALLRGAGVEVAGLWTHFATADSPDPGFAEEQVRRFDRMLAEVDADGVAVHLANSGALFLLPEAVRGRALVRVGGLLYGLPSSEHLAGAADVRPVMRLATRVVHLQDVQAGETVSYGRTWRAERPTRIATLAAGYGDGLPRQLSNRGEVDISGRRYPIAGRVCMDLL